MLLLLSFLFQTQNIDAYEQKTPNTTSTPTVTITTHLKLHTNYRQKLHWNEVNKHFSMPV